MKVVVFVMARFDDVWLLLVATDRTSVVVDDVVVNVNSNQPCVVPSPKHRNNMEARVPGA
jgi:hypothetical protein